MRTKSTLLNFISSFIPWILLGVLGFIKIKYFIKIFGPELNGLVQLAYQIFTFLSIVTLGFPAAVKYYLYEPLAKGESDKINSILSGSKQIFKKIGIIIFIGGIFAALLIPYVVLELNFPKIFVFLLFLLYSLDYLTQYLLLLPYKVILEADQKTYIVNIILNSKNILFRVFELSLILLKVNYLLILSLSVILNVIATLIITQKTKKIYKWINLKEEPDTTPLKMTKDVMYHKINSFIFNNTDIFIISVFKGLTFVSIYGAYNYIIQHLTVLLNHIFRAPQASIANFINSDKSSEEKKELLNQYWLIVFMISLIVIPIFIVGSGDFVSLWISDNYRMSNITIILFGLVLWVQTLNSANSALVNVSGLFAETKRNVLMASISNVVLSLILVHKYNFSGILFATFLSGLMLLIVNTKTVFNKMININNKNFVFKISLVICYILLFVTLLPYISSYFLINSLMLWFLKYGIIFMINCLIIVLIFNKKILYFKKLLINLRK